jgi:hypothetical protein
MGHLRQGSLTQRIELQFSKLLVGSSNLSRAALHQRCYWSHNWLPPSRTEFNPLLMHFRCVAQ